MNNPKISVIVPVYKAENYLHCCVDSLLAQTFTDFEILLIDDGSPDRSGEICDEYARMDSRIRVFHKENGGVTKARALGVEQSRGYWIFFVDSDDTIPQKSCRELYDKAVNLNLDIAIGSWNRVCQQYTRPIVLQINGILSSDQYISSLLLETCYRGPVGKLFKRTLFSDSTFDISSKIVNNEDLIMNLYIAQRSTRIGAFRSIKVYNYIQRSDSSSKQCQTVEYWDMVFDVVSSIVFDKFPKEFNNYVLTTLLFNLKNKKISYLGSKYFNFIFSRYPEQNFENKVLINVLNKRFNGYIFYLFFKIKRMIKKILLIIIPEI